MSMGTALQDLCWMALAGLLLPALMVAGEGEKPDLVPLPLELPKPRFESFFANPRAFDLAPWHGNKPILVPQGVKNVALNKPVTSSNLHPKAGELKQVTDGKKEIEEGNLVELGSGAQWVQVDLQNIFAIHAIVVWHRKDREQAHVYHDVVVQIADDADFTVNVRTVYNNDRDNSLGLGVGTQKEYMEFNEGLAIEVHGEKARYMRCYSNGSTCISDSQLPACGNDYREVEVWGLPAK
jgi:hypothetical protein